jgi:uncharacterized surface protein with fasciclin (FAS1) repeats
MNLSSVLPSSVRVAAATTLLVSLLAGCASTPTPANLAETTARTPQLSTLNKLIADAGLSDTLRSAGPYTVFAPSDEAFKAVPAKTMQELAGNRELLQSVLRFHILPGAVMAADVKVGNAKTVQGANVALGRAGTFVTVEEAMVQQPDIKATNGVVHIVDRVLLPPKR